MMINMSLATGPRVIGILLSNVCQFFNRSMHLFTRIRRLAIFFFVVFLFFFTELSFSFRK